MDVYLDAVDWRWLTGLASTQERIGALLEGTNNVGVLEGYEPWVDWIEDGWSHATYWEALELTAREFDKPLGDTILTAWAPILSGNERFDELRLAVPSANQFYLSLCPASVTRVVAALDALDLA